jgi:ABC-2 type transport system permease protein
MNTRSARLFRRELARCARSPLLWLVLAPLAAALCWGAGSAGRLHRKQAADLARVAAAEAVWYDEVRERAARYARPSPDSVPYWQDPTDAAGFSRYFLRRHAAKPHLPLSALAVGQSDLVPFGLPVRLETPFGIEPAYDFEAPRALALGPFETGFVIVHLIPLGLGALIGILGTYERDHGLLPLVAAQPVSPRAWLASRVLAIGGIAAPTVTVAVVAALALAGAPVASAGAEALAASALVFAYSSVWIGIGAIALSFWKGAAATLAGFVAAFVLTASGVPLVAGLVTDQIAPAPSSALRIDVLRRTQDALQADADTVIKAYLATRPETGARAHDPATLTYAARLTILVPELERRLAPMQEAEAAYWRAASRVGVVAGSLSPPMALHHALADLAGTGVERHRAFLAAVRTYQQELRAFLYPRVIAHALSQAAKPCPGCPGRLQFTDFDALPRFVFAEPPAADRVRRAFASAGWLAGLAGCLLAAALLRCRRWPPDVA